MKLGHLRSLLFTIPAAMLVTAVMISIAVISGIVYPSFEWQRTLYHGWASALLFIFGAKLKVVGEENLAPGGNYVVASNHASLVDTPVLFRGLPMPIRFLAKKELLKVPFIGWYLQRNGHLTVSRGSIRSSLESMNEAARLIREQKLSVLIFPEGTRSVEQLHPFKEGAAYLAIQSGTPLAPVAVVGTRYVLPAKSSHFRPGNVELRIGRPIPVEGYTLKKRGELTALLQQRVAELMGNPGESAPNA